MPVTSASQADGKHSHRPVFTFCVCKNCFKSHSDTSKLNGGLRGPGPGPVNGVETPVWSTVLPGSSTQNLKCTQNPLSSNESEPVARSLLTNTSLIIELNMLNGSFPRDYCTLARSSVIYVFQLI